MTSMSFQDNLANTLFSVSNAFATDFEKNFRPGPYIEFAANNYPLAFGLVAAYIVFIIVGTKIMAGTKPFNLKLALAGWNMLLCVFSFVGMMRTMPYLLGSLLLKPYEETVCGVATETWSTGTCGFWVMLFIFSKVPELIDTVFIVIRKKPLIFLHWYHHITVLLFCWNAYATKAGSGLYFVAMNYSVHALMYGYYCLQALDACPKWFPPILITASQILQMFIGTGVCVSCWYYKYSGRPCANEPSNLMAGAAMYGSYLYLFMDFAVRRYAFPKKSKKTASKKVE